jgi:hypothetical protein
MRQIAGIGIAVGGKSRNGSRKARETAHGHFLNAGKDFIFQGIVDARDGRSGVAEWLTRFFKLMKKEDQRHWIDLYELLIHECIPMVEQDLADFAVEQPS